MPMGVQIAISIIAMAVAIGVALWQSSMGNTTNFWAALATGAVMLFGIWIFPEAKGGRGEGG